MFRTVSGLTLAWNLRFDLQTWSSCC